MHGSIVHPGGKTQTKAAGTGNTQSGEFIVLMQFQSVNSEQIIDNIIWSHGMKYFLYLYI